MRVSVGGPEGPAEHKPEGEAKETPPKPRLNGFVAWKASSGSARVGGPEGLAEPRPGGPWYRFWTGNVLVSVGGPEGHAELKPEGEAQETPETGVTWFCCPEGTQ